jgi:membrane protease YdiL (CAAX protease family)
VLKRADSPTDRHVVRVRAMTPLSKAGTVALHIVPGVVAYLLLHLARRPLSEALGLSQDSVQLAVMTGIMLLLAVGALVGPVAVDGLSGAETVDLLGLRRLDLTGMVLAAVLAAVLLTLPTDQWYADTVSAWLQRIEWLDLDAWHFQRTGAFLAVPGWLAGTALLCNLVGEELWFRGYLQPKLSFLGQWTWVAGGILFTAYHVFEAPLVYPNPLGGLALAGLYALRRDLWSCVFLHALLQAPV